MTAGMDEADGGSGEVGAEGEEVLEVVDGGRGGHGEWDGYSDSDVRTDGEETESGRRHTLAGEEFDKDVMGVFGGGGGTGGGDGGGSGVMHGGEGGREAGLAKESRRSGRWGVRQWMESVIRCCCRRRSKWSDG